MHTDFQFLPLYLFMETLSLLDKTVETMCFPCVSQEHRIWIRKHFVRATKMDAIRDCSQKRLNLLVLPFVSFLHFFLIVFSSLPIQNVEKESLEAQLKRPNVVASITMFTFTPTPKKRHNKLQYAKYVFMCQPYFTSTSM